MSGLRFVVAAALSASRQTRGLKELLLRREGGYVEPWRRFQLRGLTSPTSGESQKGNNLEGDDKPSTTSQRPKELVMLFTCGQCNMRAAKAFSKDSYERGVVIVECPGCSSKHLIADHLGWFGSKGTVEDFAKEKGSVVMRKLADGTLELTPEEILGTSLTEEVVNNSG